MFRICLGQCHNKCVTIRTFIIKEQETKLLIEATINNNNNMPTQELSTYVSMTKSSLNTLIEFDSISFFKRYLSNKTKSNFKLQKIIQLYNLLNKIIYENLVRSN